MPYVIVPIFFAGLLSINILVINAFLAKIAVISYFFPSKIQVIGLIIVLMTVSFTYYRKVLAVTIVQKYDSESRSKRIKGNIIVVCYVIISFLAIFAVAFFRPGRF